MSVGEVVDAVMRDAPFYWQSGGGVTLSGGEATMQAAFARESERASSRDRAPAAPPSVRRLPPPHLLSSVP